MVTGRAERKRIELDAKLDGLDEEFEVWRGLSERDQPWQKHHTQIRAVLGALRVLSDVLRDRVRAGDGNWTGNWTGTENDLLRIHEVWDFFRQKFALRAVGLFRPYLDLADEFSWACYEPAQRLGSGPHHVPREEVREPPLTFLNRVATPFALPRGSSYAAEVRSAMLSEPELRRVVERLPVPLVGVPWCQLRHLPDALVLGHEVGHHVEDDFRLTPRLRALAGTALGASGVGPADRRRWQGWLGEVFADVYGTLAGGPAFAHALADFAATGPAAAAGSPTYPPVRLRVRVVAEALLRGEATGPRDELLAGWAADFPDEPDSPLDGQAAVVARALVAGPYPEFGGVALTGVLDFPSWQPAAVDTATALLRRAQLSAAIDVRCLLAAAGLAFVRDPAAYRARGVTEAVLDHVPRIAARGLRATRESPVRIARDRAAGEDLLSMLEGYSKRT